MRAGIASGWRHAAVVGAFALLWLGGAARAEEAESWKEIETKYIFGFTTGSGIGLEGEKEFTPGMVVTTTTGRVIFNDILHPKMPFYNMALGQKQLQGIIADCYQILGRAETIALLDNMKDLGFRESTRSGLSFATDDLKTPATKDQILLETEKDVLKTAKLYQRGIITEQERYNKVLDPGPARERITTEMMEQLGASQRPGLPQPDLPDGRLGRAAASSRSATRRDAG